MKIENFNNFEEYCEAKQRLTATPWTPSSDDLAARLKKEISKGLGQISGGLR